MSTAIAPPLLSLVIPTRNEELNIQPLAERIVAACTGITLELVFVDDSDDATAERIAALPTTPECAVICLARTGRQRSGGLSTAVLDGVRAARGDYLCVIDSDLQHPPEVIPRLLEEARASNCDLVVASRYVKGGSSKGLSGIVRATVSRSSSLLVHLLFPASRATTDPLSGFFLVRRDVLAAVPFAPVGFKILLEILVKSHGLSVRDYPFSMEARHAGTSKASFREGVRFLRHVYLLLTRR